MTDPSLVHIMAYAGFGVLCGAEAFAKKVHSSRVGMVRMFPWLPGDCVCVACAVVWRESGFNVHASAPKGRPARGKARREA